MLGFNQVGIKFFRKIERGSNDKDKYECQQHSPCLGSGQGTMKITILMIFNSHIHTVYAIRLVEI